MSTARRRRAAFALLMVTATEADAAEVTINLPPNVVGDLHVIPEVTDSGQPPLTTYRRVVVTVN